MGKTSRKKMTTLTKDQRIDRAESRKREREEEQRKRLEALLKYLLGETRNV